MKFSNYGKVLSLVLLCLALLSACDAGVKTIRYELEPALNSATQFVKSGLINIDFSNASKLMHPALGLSSDQVKVIVSKMARFGFPKSAELTQYKFDYANNVVAIYGQAVSEQLAFAFKAQMHTHTDGKYYIKDFTVSPLSERWVEGQEQLEESIKLNRPAKQKDSIEFEAYILREPILRFPNGKFVTHLDISYEPALAIYQKIYESEWVLEIEYLSNYQAVTSKDLLEESESAFLNTISKLADSAGVEKAIMAAKHAGREQVYRILFVKNWTAFGLMQVPNKPSQREFYSLVKRS